MPKETQSCALFLIRRSVLLTQAGLSMGESEGGLEGKTQRNLHLVAAVLGEQHTKRDSTDITIEQTKTKACALVKRLQRQPENKNNALARGTPMLHAHRWRFSDLNAESWAEVVQGTSRVSGKLLKISALWSLHSFVWDTSLNDSTWIFNSCLKRTALLDVPESEREYKREKANKGEHQELWPNVAIKAPYASIKAVHSPINTINLGNSIIPV